MQINKDCSHMRSHQIRLDEKDTGSGTAGVGSCCSSNRQMGGSENWHSRLLILPIQPTSSMGHEHQKSFFSVSQVFSGLQFFCILTMQRKMPVKNKPEEITRLQGYAIAALCPNSRPAHVGKC